MDLGLIIGLAILFFFLGLSVGYLVFSENRSGRNGQEKKPEENSIEGKELVRIWQDRKTGHLMIDTPSGRQAIQTERTIETSPAGSTSTALNRQNLPSPKANAANDPAPDHQAAVDAAPSAPAKSKSLFASLGNLWKKTEPVDAQLARQGIALQVDIVLQENLSEKYLRRGLRLIQMPDQSMVIMLDETPYSTIEQVPDEEVRKLIRDSVAEWSKRAQADRK